MSRSVRWRPQCKPGALGRCVALRLLAGAAAVPLALAIASGSGESMQAENDASHRVAMVYLEAALGDRSEGSVVFDPPGTAVELGTVPSRLILLPKPVACSVLFSAQTPTIRCEPLFGEAASAFSARAERKVAMLEEGVSRYADRAENPTLLLRNPIRYLVVTLRDVVTCLRNYDLTNYTQVVRPPDEEAAATGAVAVVQVGSGARIKFR
jgi:hypothetical protein